MKAMIPSRIFNDEDVQERLTIGAVLVLKGVRSIVLKNDLFSSMLWVVFKLVGCCCMYFQPVVFSPQPGKQYLNITERNIVHVQIFQFSFLFLLFNCIPFLFFFKDISCR